MPDPVEPKLTPLVLTEVLRNGPGAPDGYYAAETAADLGPTEASAGRVLSFPLPERASRPLAGLSPTKPDPVKLAASRRKFARKEEAYRDKLSNAFLESMGGLEEIKAALSMSESAKVQEFLSDLINKPRLTFTYLAHKHHISQQQLADIWRRYSHSKGLLAMLGAAPEIAAHVVEDSKSVQVCCPRCDGHKYIEGMPVVASSGDASEQPPPLEPCPHCGATGLVRKSGDADARRLMFQSIGYIGKTSGGVNVNVNVQSVENTIAELQELDAGGGGGGVLEAEYSEGEAT